MVLFATGPVIIAGSEVNGPVLSFWRLWIGVVLLGSATALQCVRAGVWPSAVGWAWSGGSGVAFGIHQLLFMIAIKRTSVIDVTLMQLLAPVIVAVLAVFAFGERPGAAFRLWSAVSMVGGAIVVLAGSQGASGDPLGVALAAANVVLFAFYFVGSKRARDHITTTPFLFGAVGAAALVVSTWVVIVGEPVGSISRRDLLAAAAIAVVPGALGHFVTTWQLHRVAANIPPLMQLAVPFLSGGLAWLLLDQAIGLLHVLGGAVTLGGVFGALLSPAGRRLTDRAPEPSLVVGD